LSTGKIGGKRLAFTPACGKISPMLLPNQPVTLTAAQAAELNGKLSTMRHEINNHLALIVAAVELIRMKPETSERMMETLMGQPTRISASLIKFSDEFEKTLGVTRR
jgi:hypothetical protein